jgi:hypothetical protein
LSNTGENGTETDPGDVVVAALQVVQKIQEVQAILLLLSDP